MKKYGGGGGVRLSVTSLGGEKNSNPSEKYFSFFVGKKLGMVVLGGTPPPIIPSKKIHYFRGYPPYNSQYKNTLILRGYPPL